MLADHGMYETALMILLQLGRAPMGMLAGLPLLGVRLALLEWFRAAELSCDRAAAIVVRDPLVVCRLLMAMAAGLPSDRLDLGAFLEQGRDYRDADGWAKLTRDAVTAHTTHRTTAHHSTTAHHGTTAHHHPPKCAKQSHLPRYYTPPPRPVSSQAPPHTYSRAQLQHGATKTNTAPHSTPLFRKKMLSPNFIFSMI